MASLKIFLSRASEDGPFARAIEQRLWDIFKFSVELTDMANIPLGVNWVNLIDQAVDRADILLILATGREKPSHSYTGYEVGYFSKSQEDRKYIDEKKKIERLIIPFRIFTGTPPTVDEFQGVGIEADRVVYDVEAKKIDDNDPFFKLLQRINNVLNKLSDRDVTLAQQESTRKEFLLHAELFHKEVDNFIRSLPMSTEFPKPKLTLRLPADLTPEDIKIDDRVLLSCTGPNPGIFARDPAGRPVPWSDFSKRIGGSPEIALIWNDALLSLVSSTLEGNFADTGQLVFSYDEEKLFRLFLSETRKYYDCTRQLDIYLVEILHDRDIGNPKTTFLAKMIDICMTYRSLFLENEGDYSDYAISLLTEKHKWKPRINAMLRDLRLLYARSREAGALDPRWLKEIYGDDQKAVDKIKQMKIEFDEQLNKLNKTAADVLAEPEPSQDKFDAFVQALDEFRTKRNERDTPFLTKILEHLRRIVGSGGINLELAVDMEGPTEILLDGEKVKETSTQTAALVSLTSGQH